MNSALKQHIEQRIIQNFKKEKVFNWQNVAGGSINNAYKLKGNSCNFFVKTNTTAIFSSGFKEEVLGLNFLKEFGAKIPKVYFEGIFNNYCYVVLEYIEIEPKSEVYWNNLATHLVTIHKNSNEKFGLNYSNFMGQLPQNNSWKNSFPEFFIENRLLPQIELAFDKGYLNQQHNKQFNIFFSRLNQLLPKENPSAVHGDLWSGNCMCTTNGKAVFIDPAVSYSHREVDLAMTMLFGGFPNLFYQVYNNLYPLQNGFMSRYNFYNLYPLLVHLNLFGFTYLSKIESILKKF